MFLSPSIPTHHRRFHVQVKSEKDPAYKDVGVFFCGAPGISKDLADSCKKYSAIAENTLFTLHKENF